MSENTVENLINMLRDAVDQGTGQAVRTRFDLRADVAGKTGTTQRNTDGWFILMHPRLVAGAWVGFNDSRVTMRSNYWGAGGQNALLLVGDFFRQALDARLIDGRARFPYSRPSDSIWDPYLDSAKEWLDGLVRDWLLGERAKPTPLPPRRDLEQETPRERFDDRKDRREESRLEREHEKERLMERLRQKREQWTGENLERDWYLRER
jgi:penicillin-binding protein 1A